MHCAVSIVCLVSVVFSAQGDAKKELEKLQGSWVLTGVTGQTLPAGLHKGLVFTGDKYQGITNGKVDEGGTFRLDVTTRLTAIDLVITEGQLAGKTQLGVVEVAGNTLRLALAEPGAVRPVTLSQETLTLTKVTPLGKEFEGTWAGAIEGGGKTLRVEFRLSNGADGLPAGAVVSVDQGNREAPITAIVISGSHVKVVIPAIRGTFDGDLKDGALVGTWSQSAGSTPLTLRRPA